MEYSKLSGIERDLVLQYLADGNVPVTLTVVSQKTSEIPVTQIFPIAIKGEHVKLKENGSIKLENPSQSVIKFSNKKVKVEFYFQQVGLFFYTQVKEVDNGLELPIPDEIERIADVEEDVKYDFTALVYFEFKTQKDLKLNCIPWNEIELFNKPVWKSIPDENQRKARDLLEIFVNEAKIEKNVGNGIQLIPICNYLTYNHVNKMEALQNRKKPLNILYVDHQRIVLGVDFTDYTFAKNDEYGIKFQFMLKNGPINSRDIYVTSYVNKIYMAEEGKYMCLDLCYSNIQEEDMRYLYERTTQNLFI